MKKKILLLVFSITFLNSIYAGTGIFESYVIVNSNYYAQSSFNGQNFGTLNTNGTLVLNGGEIKTWKNNGGDVTGAFLYYRVYKTGESAPSFVELNLPWDSNLDGNNQKWAKGDYTVNLLAGLDAGNYSIEVYFKATTNEGDRYDNNGGSNYIASFTVENEDKITLNGIVTITPSTPTRTEQVHIELDATGTDLESASKIYLHSGVATDTQLSTSFNKTVGNWGQDDGIGEMTRIGVTNVWEITLTSIDNYYSLTTNDDAFGLNFLFRDETGTNKEDNSGNNYHLDINPENYFLIKNPTYSPFLVETLQSFNLTAEANTSANWTLIELDENDNVINSNVFSDTTQSFSFSHSLSDIGVTHYFQLQVDFGTETKSKFFEITAYGSIIDEAKPTGAKKGINYNLPNNDEVTLVLHTPTSTTYSYYDSNNCSNTSIGNTQAKNVVHLIGDFNNWEISNAYQLKRDGDYWWITLNTSSLTENEYVYQYLVDGKVRVGDPYANKISDPDDQYISSDVYPNLIAYPSDKTSGRASVLELNKTNYSWQVESFDRNITSNNLNVYELHFRDFTAEGTYKAATTKLDYIQNMGINCIHVMPVSEFEGNNSWGYNPNYYFAADKAYGTANDLKEFIDEAHKRGISVVNDLVLNHAFYSNPMAQLYWNETQNRPADDSPYFNPTHKGIYDTAGHWGADWNHASEHTQNMVDDILSYWIEEFKFDGFRFDFTKGFTQADQDSNDPWASSYDVCRVEILQRMISTMWTNNPGTYAIFEHLANDDEDKELADFGILMWSGAGPQDSWMEMAMGTNTESFWSSVYQSRNFTYANYMSYMESHDEERVGYKVKTWGQNNDASDSYLSNRTKLPAAFNLLLPGPRMVWQFGELAYDISIDDNGRTGDKPSAWELNYDQNLERLEVYNFYSHLFNFRNSFNLYSSIDFGNIGSEDSWVRRMSLADATNNGVHASTQVIVVGNFDTATNETVTPGYLYTGDYYKYNGDPTVDGTKFTVSSTSDNFSLLKNDPVYILSNTDIIAPQITPKGFSVESMNACNLIIPANDTQYDIIQEPWVGGVIPSEGFASDNGTITELYYSKINNVSTTGKPSSLAGTTLNIGENIIDWIVTDSFGNSNSCVQVINVTTSVAYPTVSVFDVSPISLNSSTTISVENPNINYTYQWFNQESDVTSISTGNSYSTQNLNETRSYWVQAVDNTSLCTSSKVEVVVEVNATLGLEIYNYSSISVFPNPASNSIKIKVPSNINKLIGFIEFYNRYGQLVLTSQSNLKDGYLNANIKNLSKGIYFAKLYLDKNYNVKIIKK